MTGRATALLEWYAGNGRKLPWRGVTDPYAVLVSETMLQQTQAARVAPRYEAFLEAFPTAAVLAAAPLADVLASWSGLGYNTRARRLREAARIVTAEGWPTTVAGLLRLPGVGPYTAAAVAYFAFGAEIPAADTNARRVLSRWRGEALDGAALAEAATQELAGSARHWNQAIMDLGAKVCLPRTPRCESCPVQQWCAGPDAYVPPRPQSQFARSGRQVRGSVVRELLAGPLTPGDLAARTGFGADRIEGALAGLLGDALVETAGDAWRISSVSPPGGGAEAPPPALRATSPSGGGNP